MLLLVGVGDISAVTQAVKWTGMWVASSEGMYCANACRIGRRNSSFPTKCCACAAVAFLYGIIYWSVDYGCIKQEQYWNTNNMQRMFYHLKSHSCRLVLRRTELPVQYICTDLSLLQTASLWTHYDACRLCTLQYCVHNLICNLVCLFVCLFVCSYRYMYLLTVFTSIPISHQIILTSILYRKLVLCPSQRQH